MDQVQEHSSPSGFEQQLREVVARLGSALGQSDFTDDPIIVRHILSAHALALHILHADRTN